MAGERRPDSDFWRGRRVFLTGHTGFVGGWLAFWLARMGARVTGFSLDPPTEHCFYHAVRLADLVSSVHGDVRDGAKLTEAIAAARPHVLLHLAAQPLVSVAFRQPYETFTTNVLGTLNVLEAASAAASVEAVAVFTTDKVYAEAAAPRPFQEDDPLGGAEPYALSKASAEFAALAYRHSQAMHNHGDRALVTVRAGNIIGGGDWAADRLVPDGVRAFQAGRPLMLRKPNAVRPWQFVLDAVDGLLLLAEAAGRNPQEFSGAWNFGPIERATATVATVADSLVRHWGPPASWQAAAVPSNAETLHLSIDSSKAVLQLGWKPRVSFENALARTIAWYRYFYAGDDMLEITSREIDEYCSASAPPQMPQNKWED
jgi:CDP-glucose 4,6-dehydratase